MTVSNAARAASSLHCSRSEMASAKRALSTAWGLPPPSASCMASARSASACAAAHSPRRFLSCAWLAKSITWLGCRPLTRSRSAMPSAKRASASSQRPARIGEPASAVRVGGMLGYANASALSRAFTQKLGLSPRDWLKSQPR